MYHWTVLLELLAELQVTSQPWSCIYHTTSCDAEVPKFPDAIVILGSCQCAEASYTISDLLFQLLSVLNSSMDQAGRVSLTQNPLHSVTYWYLTILFNSSQLVFPLILPLYYYCPSLRRSSSFWTSGAFSEASQVLCSASILPLVWEHMTGIQLGLVNAHDFRTGKRERNKLHIKLELLPFLMQRVFLWSYISRKADTILPEAHGCLAPVYHLPLRD